MPSAGDRTIRLVSVSDVGWPALRRSPRRLLLSRAPWLSVRYLLIGTALGFTWLLVVLVWLAASLLLLPLGIGALLIAALVTLGPRVVAHDRARLGMAPRPRSRWNWRRPWEPLGQRDTWREFGYLLLVVFVVWVVEAVVSVGLLLTAGTLISTPVLVLVFGDQLVVGGPPLRSYDLWPLLPLAGAALLVPTCYLWVAVATARAALVRAMSESSRAELGAQLVEVGRSRARLLDAFEMERQRIERDLHDGAQQRLVSLAMTLGLTQVELEDNGDVAAASRLVAEARRDATRALTELRELVRGIHPQVLTDRGIAAAIEELAVHSGGMTVVTGIDLPGRPSPLVESTVYFAVSEALSNAAKHGAANRVEIRGVRDGDTLVVTVSDDGRGGADPERGTGLQGMVDRVAATGGTLLLASPIGGPTELRMEIPWTANAAR